MGRVRPSDTSSDVQRRLDEHYLDMTPAAKGESIRDAWRTARALALAGLRIDHPGESDEQLELRWAERRLGRELFEKAAAQLRRSTR